MKNVSGNQFSETSGCFVLFPSRCLAGFLKLLYSNSQRNYLACKRRQNCRIDPLNNFKNLLLGEFQSWIKLIPCSNVFVIRCQFAKNSSIYIMNLCVHIIYKYKDQQFAIYELTIFVKMMELKFSCFKFQRTYRFFFIGFKIRASYRAYTVYLPSAFFKELQS